MTDSARFFEHGVVTVEETDPRSRQAALSMTMPNCLFQAVTPSLLGGGLIDNFRLAEPLSVWLPQVTEGRLSFVGTQVDNAVARMNTIVRNQAEVVLQTFAQASNLLLSPADLIPMLPMGVYVSLRFRCRVDDIPKVLEGVQGTPVVGVAEFQWALATALAAVLTESAAWAPRPALSGRSP